jgi:hypothetical protein
MRGHLPHVLFAFLAACSAKGSDNHSNDIANLQTNDLTNELEPTALERLQQGDKTLCADKDTLITVSSVLADLSHSGDGFRRMSEKGENLSYEFIAATGYNRDLPELSCSGTLTLSSEAGQIKPIISWKLRPNLSSPGSLMIEATVPTEVASAVWWTMADKYPDPRQQQLIRRLQRPTRTPEQAPMKATDPGTKETIDTDSNASTFGTNFSYSNTI